MKLRSIILAVASVAVLALLVLLFLEVRDSSSTKLSSQDEAAALAKAQRSRLASPEPEPVSPGVRSKARSVTRERTDPDEPTPRRDLRAAPIPRPALKDTLKQPQMAPVGGGDDDNDETKKKMAEATRLYDKGDYPAAEELAVEVLAKSPRNIKMLRIVVSANCAVGEVDSARPYYNKLPKKDKAQMKTRCAKWGAEL